MNEIIKDINKYNIIEGILDIKNNLLFNSKEKLEVEVYINNKKIKIIKEGNQYKLDDNINKEKYEFKIYIKNKIKDIYFENCINLYSIDFTNFDTSNITNMEGMFSHCHQLKELKGINNFKTSKVKNMRGMFNECNNLINLDLNFDTSNVIDMECMFNEFMN